MAKKVSIQSPQDVPTGTPGNLKGTAGGEFDGIPGWPKGKGGIIPQRITHALPAKKVDIESPQEDSIAKA